MQRLQKFTKRTGPILTALLSTGFTPILVHDSVAADQDRDTLTIGRKRVPYYCNRPLAVKDPGISRAIIVIHGSGRKVAEYFDTILDTLQAGADPARDWRHKTVVLAPHFQEKDEAAKHEYWWKGDWSSGGNSGGISSFSVVDTLVARLRGGSFPNLKWIVITGHSAGGQFVQRYAAFTDIDLQPVPNAAFVKFVPSNPSSYIYLNEYRFNAALNTWEIPRGRKSKDYDKFKYGLDDLEDYAGDRGASWARSYLPRRWVELLAGTADIFADSSFDDSKEAMWQGHSRYDRAQRFGAFMDRFYASNRFSVTPVPNVGHDHRQIYASPEAKNALYFPD